MAPLGAELLLAPIDIRQAGTVEFVKIGRFSHKGDTGLAVATVDGQVAGPS